MVPGKTLPLAPCALSPVSAVEDWAKQLRQAGPAQWLSKWVVLRWRGAEERRKWARPKPGVGVTLILQVTSPQQRPGLWCHPRAPWPGWHDQSRTGDLRGPDCWWPREPSMTQRMLPPAHCGVPGVRCFLLCPPNFVQATALSELQFHHPKNEGLDYTISEGSFCSDLLELWEYTVPSTAVWLRTQLKAILGLSLPAAPVKLREPQHHHPCTGERARASRRGMLYQRKLCT